MSLGILGPLRARLIVVIRYYVPGATGKEVIIFDLYPDTGGLFWGPSRQRPIAYQIPMPRLSSNEYRRQTRHREDRDKITGPGHVQ